MADNNGKSGRWPILLIGLVAMYLTKDFTIAWCLIIPAMFMVVMD